MKSEFELNLQNLSYDPTNSSTTPSTLDHHRPFYSPPKFPSARNMITQSRFGLKSFNSRRSREQKRSMGRSSGGSVSQNRRRSSSLHQNPPLSSFETNRSSISTISHHSGRPAPNTNIYIDDYYNLKTANYDLQQKIAHFKSMVYI